MRKCGPRHQQSEKEFKRATRIGLWTAKPSAVKEEFTNMPATASKESFARFAGHIKDMFRKGAKNMRIPNFRAVCAAPVQGSNSGKTITRKSGKMEPVSATAAPRDRQGKAKKAQTKLDRRD